MAFSLKAIALAALSVVGVRAEEQPPFDVVDRVGAVEIRAYGARIAAEVTVPAESEARARGEAFNLLAAYIFGGNRARQQIPMTAPVQTEGGRTIPQISPVGPETLTMRFFLPAGITRANAPAPDDARVKLINLPPETIAVLRYAGGWTPAAVRERYAELMELLSGARWTAAGAPFSLFYDPPFTLPPLRRNEAAVRVTQTSKR